MRRKLIIVGILMFMLTLGGCAKKDKDVAETTEAKTETTTETITTEQTTEQAKPDYEEEYAEIIHHTYDLIVADFEDIDTIADEDLGVYEVKLANSVEDSLKVLGYTLKDISGDGVPELIIGDINGYIYAIYGHNGETPVFIVSSTYRSSKQLMEDGKTLTTYGSSGAAYTIFGKMHIATDGQTLEWDECYFTYPDEDYNLHFYHNTTGVWDPSEAEELAVDEETFWQYDTTEGIMIDLGLTLFKDMPGGSYEPSDESDGNTNAETPHATGTSLDVMLAEECRSSLTNYDALDITNGGEFSEEVAFRPVDGSISDIYFYEIEYMASNEGNQWFKEIKTLTYYSFLNSDQQLVVKMTFPGDMPTIGFSYKNGAGEEQHYAISLSGYDGSVVISPYYPDNE